MDDELPATPSYQNLEYVGLDSHRKRIEVLTLFEDIWFDIGLRRVDRNVSQANDHVEVR